MCVRLSIHSAPIEWIFIKFYILVFLENVLIRLKFLDNLTRITATLHEDRYTFLSYLAHVFLE
jgi:hypothetical protein